MDQDTKQPYPPFAASHHARPCSKRGSIHRTTNCEGDCAMWARVEKRTRGSQASCACEGPVVRRRKTCHIFGSGCSIASRMVFGAGASSPQPCFAVGKSQGSHKIGLPRL